MSTSIQKKLPITRLRVNPNNVRYEGSAKDQHDAIRRIIQDQGRKFVNLCKHIATHGLEPGRSVYVHPINGTKDYLVLDGNRRMSAVKVLLSKELQKEFKELLPKNFSKVSESFMATNRIEAVECSVFVVEEDAREWIAVNHGFGEDGITTQDWNSDIRGKVMAYYKKAKRHYDGQILDYLREADIVDDSFKQRLRTEQTNNTALRRFLSVDVLPKIGINFNNGVLGFNTSQREVVKTLVHVVTDLIDKKKKTKDVWDEKAREKYLKELFEKGYMPDLTMSDDSPSNNESILVNENITFNNQGEVTDEEVKYLELAPVQTDNDAKTSSSQSNNSITNEEKPVVFDLGSDDPEKINTEQDTSDVEEDEEVIAHSRPRPIRKGRECVFSKSLKISNKNSRITDIYNELVRIRVTENPNAVSFLLRAFVEMLVKEYDKKNKVPSTGKDVALWEAVKRAVEHFKNKHGKAYDHDFRGILEACDQKNKSSIFAIESFQQLVHREQLKPIPSEVITRWDNIEPAIVHLLANT